MDVTTGKHKMDRIPKCIYNSVNFCGLSTSTNAYKLVVF